MNDYTVLTADVSSGSTSIQVSNNSLSSGFGSNLAQGDLVFIIQIQGAGIVTLDDPTYGNISSYNNCGKQEFAQVASVSGSNSISLTCPLQNSYTSAGRVEVVRVPRYTTLNVSAGSSITCPAWNGSTGGIVAIEVQGLATINGNIDVSAKGFRGGNLFDNNSTYGVLNYRWPTDDYGAEKGESIAGSVTDYDNMGGRYCKGAPANGGGGGSGHNTGGGGGGNAGTSAYNGNGTPDVSNSAWSAAWNLEYAGFAGSVSSGGGKGGYSFSSSNQNALTVGPFNSAWGGDFRRDNGGRGGRPLDYSGGRIFFGGGGGAGEQNDSKGGRGGNGGGIITIFSYDAISGSGQIVANGENGTNSLTNNGTDGSGGGGGGGTIILNTTNTTSGVSVNANGGTGGSQSVQFFNLEAEGPGGGGGGGFIAITNGAPARSANGAANGTTNSASLSEFPPNGATRGGQGISNATLNPFRILPQTVNICSGVSKVLTVSTSGTPPPGAVYYWYDQAIGGSLLGTGTSYTTPVLTSSQTYYITSCPGFSRVAVNVVVNGSMTSSFTSNGNCTGSPVTFTGTGSSNIVSWYWDFGDATAPSTQQNPTHSYSAGGSYQVVLTVGDGVCTMSVSQNITITNNPVSNFTSSASGTTCGSLPVQFTNASTGATGYSWNFGDGTPLSTQTNPSHTFPGSGTYIVVLTASNSGCTSTHSLSVNIGPRPLASFSSSTSTCTNDIISFTNLSNGNGGTITSYSWNFGDGSAQSSQQNPTHSYSAGGLYNVTLTTNTANCFDDTTIAITITPTPVINFAASASNGCSPLTVNFSNTTTGSPVYSWNFGDGSPLSNAATPSHIYTTSGTYSVTLIATQNGCGDTLVIPNMITIANSPLASFTGLTSICLSDSLHFNDISNGNGSSITSYNWDFDDGNTSTLQNPVHAYATPGTYNVRLTVSNGSCSDDTIQAINVSPGPVASFTTPFSTSCGPLTTTLTNTTSGSATFTWNFGDGSPLSNVVSPTHTYTGVGVYTVTLIASQGTCSDTLTMIDYFTVADDPFSSFNATNPCFGDSVYFNNTSNGGGLPITSYFWDFDDGNYSSLQSPAHFYTSPGTYNVQLSVFNAGCANDTIIPIVVSPAPAISFSSNTTTACDSATIVFSNSTTSANSYTWNFGDGNTSTAASPAHTYLSAGSYTVTLTATNGSCSTAQSKLNLIVIRNTPVVNITTSQNSICKGDCISFNGSGSGATSWLWNFQGASPVSSGAQNPSNICYNSTGNYDVTLTATDGFCTGTQTLQSIHVVDCAIAPRSNFISSDTAICAKDCISFVDISSNAQTWQWYFPGAFPPTTNLEHPGNVCYSQSGTYDVMLITSNPAGTDTLLLTNFIQVSPAPAVPVITQNGNNLTASSTGQCQWFLNNIPLAGANSQNYTALLSGDYSVMVTDAGGCTSTSSVLHVSLVGIEEEDGLLSFNIYPNPVSDNFSIQIQAKKQGKLTVSIYDAIGRKVFFDAVLLSSKEQTFNYRTENITAGMYFLHVTFENRKWLKPLVKN